MMFDKTDALLKKKWDCGSVLLCVIIVAMSVNMFIKREIDHFLSEKMLSGKVVVVYAE